MYLYASSTQRVSAKDRLTGLYNRIPFFKQASKMISAHSAGYYIFACVNIEGFKTLNDQYGIVTGDLILQHVANCINDGLLSADIKDKGICGRNIADDFMVLYPAEWESDVDASDIHQKICTPSCIDRHIRIRIGRYKVESTGLSMFEVYARAKIAADSAHGRYARYIVKYKETMRTDMLRQHFIIDHMVNAVRHDEIKMYLQPQYDHSTKKIIGAEALARWQYKGEFIFPNEFIPIFESTGFVYELDRFMWEECCKLIRKEIDEGYPLLPVSFNISRFDILQEDFPATLMNLLKKYDVPVDLFKLEITESTFKNSIGEIIPRVNELIRIGFSVAIDDFGSEYSSLNLLKDIKADILKLDLRFFEDTKNQDRADIIIESTVNMAKQLNMTIIAEGIEKKVQADKLMRLGSNYVQGYLYAKPMPQEEYEKKLKAMS